MSTKHIASSTFWQLASQGAMAALSILATKFIAISLDKELVGYYNSAYGYLQIFAIVADFGLYALSVREVSKAQDKERVFGALLVIRSMILCMSIGVAILAVWLLPLWRGTPFPLGVTIAALVPFFTLLAGMLRTIFQVHYHMRFVFIAEVAQRVLTTAGIGCFIVAGVRLSQNVAVYEAFLWIGGAGACLLFVISLVYASRFMRIRPCFDRALLMHFVFLAAPYGFAYLLMAMYRQLDIVFITLLRPDFAVQNAYYGFAGRVEDMAFLVPTFLLNSILPILSSRLNRREDVRALLGKTFLLLLLSGSVFLLFSWLWARPLTLMFATKQYLSTMQQAGADRAFELMGIPMFLNGLILFSFYVFLAQHAWKRLMASFAVGVALTIVLNLLWTSAYGFVGAAFAMIVVHVVLTLILLPQTLRSSLVRIKYDELKGWILFSLLLALILLVIEPWLQSGFATAVAGAAMMPMLVGIVFMLGMQKIFLQRETTLSMDSKL